MSKVITHKPHVEVTGINRVISSSKATRLSGPTATSATSVTDNSASVCSTGPREASRRLRRIRGFRKTRSLARPTPHVYDHARVSTHMRPKTPHSVKLHLERLVARRHTMGWTQEELAHRAGLDKRTIEAAEAGEPVPATAVESVAEALGVAANELIGAPPPQKRPKVFICHANEDAKIARELYQHLTAAGADPWLDKKKLVLGDDWEREIKKAVAGADAFVVCLRPGFDDVGFRQKEVRWAIEALQLRPPGRGFIIPFIIEPCEIPDWCVPFHAGGDLSKPTSVGELLRAVAKHSGSPAKRTLKNTFNSLVMTTVQYVRRRKGLAVVAIVAILAGVGYVRLSEELWYKEGVQLTELKDWKKADAAFKKARRFGGSTRTLFGHCRMKSKFYNARGCSEDDRALLDEAHDLCEEGLDRDPNNAQGWNTFGGIRKKQGSLTDAIEAFQKATKLDQHFYAAWVNLATGYALEEKFSLAESSFETAIKLAREKRDPVDLRYTAQAWRNAASLELFRGKQHRASEDIRTAIGRDPTNGPARTIYARILLRSGDPSALEEALHQARRADDDAKEKDGRAKRVRALTYLRNGKPQEAIQAAMDAIELDDLATVNHLIIAIAEAGLGRVEDARSRVQTAVDTWPEQLRAEEDRNVSADKGVLWFDTAAELIALKAEAEGLISKKGP